MDMITLAMAKSYVNSRIGDAEKTNVLLRGEMSVITTGEPATWLQGRAMGLEPGNTYNVTLGGYIYTAVAKTAIYEEIKLAYFGNLALADPELLEDTGESFLVVDMVIGNDVVGIVFDRNGATTCIVTETIPAVDPKHLPDGGFGYAEKKVLTYDGNPEGKDSFDFNGTTLIRIDDVIDLTTVTKVEVVMGGSTVQMTTDEATISQLHTDISSLVVQGVPRVYVVLLNNYYYAYPGTYVAKDDALYVSRIEYETIHPIDHKFLPGVCLPVVELSTTIKNGATLTAEENTMLNEAYEKDTAVVMKLDLDPGADGIVYTDCASFATKASVQGTRMFVIAFGVMVYMFTSTDGTSWTVSNR